MRGSLKLITAPTVEPVVLADVKEWCRIESSVTTDDNLLTGLITSARKVMERYTKRALMTQTWDWFLSEKLPDLFELPLPPVQSVTGIYFTDTNDVEAAAESSSKYVLDNYSSDRPARIWLKTGDSWSNTSVRDFLGTRIRFVSGYGATAYSGVTVGSLPEPLMQALKMMILDAYENRFNVNDYGRWVTREASRLMNSYRLYNV